MISSALLFCLMILGILCANFSESFHYHSTKLHNNKVRLPMLSSKSLVSHANFDSNTISNFAIHNKERRNVIEIDSLRSLKKHLTAAGNNLVVVGIFAPDDGE